MSADIGFEDLIPKFGKGYNEINSSAVKCCVVTPLKPRWIGRKVLVVKIDGVFALSILVSPIAVDFSPTFENDVSYGIQARVEVNSNATIFGGRL